MAVINPQPAAPAAYAIPPRGTAWATRHSCLSAAGRPEILSCRLSGPFPSMGEKNHQVYRNVNLPQGNEATKSELRIVSTESVSPESNIKGSKVIWTFSPHIYAAA